MDATEVVIPIFLHPHLFWFFETKNTLQRLQIESELREEYKDALQSEHFAIGELVITYSKKIWCRAIVKDIIKGPFKYEVWLMDYGHLWHTNQLYKAHQKYKTLSALVKSGSLYNVVFIDETLSLENSCILRFKNPNPNAGSTISALQFLKGYELYFLRKKELKGINFGDILFKKHGHTSSLTKTLVGEGLMIEDEEMFVKIQNDRISDGNFYIQALRQASKIQSELRTQDLSLLMGEILTRTSRGLSLSRTSDSESTETSGKSMSTSEIMKKLRGVKSVSDCEGSETSIQNMPRSEVMRKLRGASNTKQTCTESESEYFAHKSETINDTTSRSNESETSQSKRSGMLNLLRRQKAAFGIKTDLSSENGESDYSLPERRAQNALEYNSSQECENTEKPSNPLVSLRLKNEKLRKEKENMSLSDMETSSNFQSRPKLMEANADKAKASRMSDAPQFSFQPAGLRQPRQSRKKAKIDSSTSYHSDSSCSYRDKSSKPLNSSQGSGSEINKKLTEIKENFEPSKDGAKHSDPEWNENKLGVSKLAVKPQCVCPQCEHWTNSDDWRVGAENFTEDCKLKELEIMRSQSLLLKGKRENVLKLNSVDYKSMTKIQKQAFPKVLVHGHSLPLPVENIAEACFHGSIHQSLRSLGYSRIKKIQGYTWPAITRSMNVCCIHRKGSGKTIAYLAPVLSFLLEKSERYKDWRRGGPIVTIICSDSAQCEEVYDLCCKLLKFETRKPKILLVTYPNQHINMSSVDMIITIPPVLIDVMKKNATNLKRLCHLVLDKVDALFEKYSAEITQIVTATESMLSNRITGQTVQIIMTGEHWTKAVESFILKLRDIPLISIGDYLEAGLYGRMKLGLKCVKSEAKRDVVIDILKDKWKFLKSIIVCSHEKEIAPITSCLMLSSISFTAITKDLSKEQILQQEANWEYQSAGDYKVLICTDRTMHTMLSITSASLLINYSLPENWTSLIKRYNCLLENLRSPFMTDNSKLVCESYILIDETCTSQIPRLYSVLKDFNLPLNEFEQISKQITMKKEQNKIVTREPLCLSLKQFGYCHVEDCTKRHILDSNLDSNPFLPKSGSIKFKILEILDVNHFKIDIVEHIDLEGNVKAFESENAIETTKLTSILTENREKVQDFVQGKTYAFWDTEDFDDVFRECIVEEVKENIVCILVKESGRIMQVSKNKIFHLPEEICVGAHEGTVSLIVANIKPPYKDENFCARAFWKLKEILAEFMTDNLFVANICLQLDDTVWVNRIDLEVDVFNLKLTKVNLMQEISQQRLAVANEEHIKTMRTLCSDAGIILPEYRAPVTKKVAIEMKQTVPHWAFLEMDNYNKIFISSAVSPDEIYVRLQKFDSLLINLENEIAHEVKRQSSKHEITITEGKYYLAKDIDGKYCRVYIIRIENDEALCFSVDYGDESIVKLNDIKYLSNHLIAKLPFQAIQCNLHGIEATDDDWVPQATDLLYDLIFENDSDYFRTLYAKCVNCKKGNFKGQSTFSIVLKDGREMSCCVNEVMLDCGFAISIPGEEITDFEIISDIESSDAEENFDDLDKFENINDILKTTEMVDSNVTQPAVHKCNLDELECFFGGSEEEEQQFMDFMTMLIRGSTEREATKSTPRILPAIEAAPFEVDYCTPDVYWSQTLQTIQLIIKLPNIQKHKLKIQNSRIFIFEAFVDNKKYALNILLFEAVEKQISEHLGGLELRVNLKKIEELEWPKLSNSKKKLRNIHYMLSAEEMQEEKKKRFLDLGDEFNEPLWEGEDAPMFTVVSDLDSDLDFDLRDDSDY